MSNAIPTSVRERFQLLLMGAVDNELTPNERQEFQELVDTYPEFNREWQEYNQLKEVVRTMKFNTPSDEVWDRYWLGIYNRLERGLGWIMFSIGIIIVLTYTIYQFIQKLFLAQDLHVALKLGIIALIAGVVILLISVAREKLAVRKKDPYKEVQR